MGSIPLFKFEERDCLLIPQRCCQGWILKMKIDHSKLTIEELEEFVEFVDWSLVYSHLLTEDIIEKFGSLPMLKARLWFEDLMRQMVVKEDQKKYPGWKFYFIGEKCYMELEEKNGYLYCSYDLIWSVFKTKLGLNYGETQKFIKNVVEMHFKLNGITPVYRYFVNVTLMEMHFKLNGITPEDAVIMLNI